MNITFFFKVTHVFSMYFGMSITLTYNYSTPDGSDLINLNMFYTLIMVIGYYIII